MNYYLSSYKIGGEKEVQKLKQLIPKNKKTAYISNALDFLTDHEVRKTHEESDIKDLTSIGLEVELFDLRKYFGKTSKLQHDLSRYGMIWVSGGNVFVLQQAYKLSGFDELLKKFNTESKAILYGGYSAGVCILAPSLKGLELVDSIDHRPYKEATDIIWEGLCLIDYHIVPHYQSDHPESEAVNRVIEYYRKHNLPFKTLRDGEVIIIS